MISTISARCEVCEMLHDSFMKTHSAFEKSMLRSGWTKLINSENRKVYWVCPECAYIKTPNTGREG